MSDPLSLSASIAGLITLSTAVYSALSDFADRVERAPKSTQEILHVVVEMRLALTSISGLIDSFQRIPPRRKAMVQLDHLVICVSQTVLTFRDLELLLSNWPEISSMQSNAWKRIRWALQEDKAIQLVKRLQDNKTSLLLILNILHSESDFEAQISNQTLREQMEKLMTENREMRALMNQIGDDIQTITGSIKFHDDDSLIQTPTSPITPRSQRTALRPAINRPFNTPHSPERELTTEDSSSSSPNSGDTHYWDTLDTEPSTPTSLSSSLSTSLPRRSFSIILDTTWVYGRVRNHAADLSMTSSRLESRAWSMFSGLSLNDVSVVSFIRLPLKLSDIPNNRWYQQNYINSFAPLRPLRLQENIVIAILGEPISGKSSLADRICGDDFNPSQQATIEARRVIKPAFKGRRYQVEIVDTAGIFSYEHLVDAAIWEAHGFIITCPARGADLTAVEKFHKKILNKNEAEDQDRRSPVVIAVTKHDLVGLDRTTCIEDARALAKQKECNFHITSAKDGVGIEIAFSSLLGALLGDEPPKENRPTSIKRPRLMGWT